MNPAILQKCADELKQKKPNIKYVIGVLETLVEVAGGAPTRPVHVTDGIGPLKVDIIDKQIDEILTDEDKEYARKMAGGPFGKLN